MTKDLTSNYDCASAGDDLHELKQQLASLEQREDRSAELENERNRLRNQISFIMNKCDIR
ncbi:DUF2524 domain-containing protein [Paenibacillus sp. y28]|uniref:DUF2524 domain-containing protein n=1 Tax=Paenibacillus sp. y28 TaxID=3129110 RepID=UPI00301AE67A